MQVKRSAEQRGNGPRVVSGEHARGSKLLARARELQASQDEEFEVADASVWRIGRRAVA